MGFRGGIHQDDIKYDDEGCTSIKRCMDFKWDCEAKASLFKIRFAALIHWFIITDQHLAYNSVHEIMIHDHLHLF